MNYCYSNVTKSNIGFGCAYLARELTYSTTNKLIHTAIDCGINHFDVAPSYGRGTAERTLGVALKGHRERVSITTKVGITRVVDSELSLALRALLSPIRAHMRNRASLRRHKVVTRPRTATNFTLDYVKNSTKNSLKELNVKYLDVLLLHMVTADDVNDELLRYLESLKTLGIVKHIGIATTIEDSVKIETLYPNTFDIIQRAWSIDDIVINHNSSFVITHGIIVNSLSRLLRDQVERMNLYKTLSKDYDLDLFDRNILTSLLIGAAMSVNKNGTVLLATRNTKRLEANLQAASNENYVELGQRFLRAIGSV